MRMPAEMHFAFVADALIAHIADFHNFLFSGHGGRGLVQGLDARCFQQGILGASDSGLDALFFGPEFFHTLAVCFRFMFQASDSS